MRWIPILALFAIGATAANLPLINRSTDQGKVVTVVGSTYQLTVPASSTLPWLVKTGTSTLTEGESGSMISLQNALVTLPDCALDSGLWYGIACSDLPSAVRAASGDVIVIQHTYLAGPKTLVCAEDDAVIFLYCSGEYLGFGSWHASGATMPFQSSESGAQAATGADNIDPILGTFPKGTVDYSMALLNDSFTGSTWWDKGYVNYGQWLPDTFYLYHSVVVNDGVAYYVNTPYTSQEPPDTEWTTFDGYPITAGTPGPTGPTGAPGATGPTGPAWTTSAEARASITDEVGTGAALFCSTSAELATALSDETGSGGGFVRATSPTITTPTLNGTVQINSVGVTALSITANAASGHGVYSEAWGTAPAVEGRNTGTGYGVYARNGNVSRAPFRIEPMSAAPTNASPAQGEIYVTTGPTGGTGVLYIRDNGAWTRVANQADALNASVITAGTLDNARLDSELSALAGLTSAADALPYFTGSGTASTTTMTSAARGLLDDTDATAMRSTLGLVIGTNVQAYDAELAALASTTSAADAVPYFTGSGTASTLTCTSAARTVLDDTTVAAMVNTLGGATSTGTGGLVRIDGSTLTGTTAVTGPTGSLQVTGQAWSTQPSTVTTSGTTFTCNFALGNECTFDAQGSSGNLTATFSNPQAGASYAIKLIQGSSARTYTWPGTVKWPGGTAPTVTTTNDGVDLISCYYDGTNYLCSFILDVR